MFNFEGNLTDTISISESLANRSSQRLSDAVGLVENMQTNPTALADLLGVSESLAGGFVKSVTDGETVAEALVKSAIIPGVDTTAITEASVLSPAKIFGEALGVVESKVATFKKYLTASLTLADSSVEYEYPFPFFKWMAACHGGI